MKIVGGDQSVDWLEMAKTEESGVRLAVRAAGEANSGIFVLLVQARQSLHRLQVPCYRSSDVETEHRRACERVPTAGARQYDGRYCCAPPPLI